MNTLSGNYISTTTEANIYTPPHFQQSPSGRMKGAP